MAVCKRLLLLPWDSTLHQAIRIQANEQWKWIDLGYSKREYT
jgi:hypothetical protein